MSIRHVPDFEGDHLMNIGEAASASGVSAKMIRHHEELALLPAARRTESGYRQYGENEVHTLRFIRHSRGLGFSLAEIAELVSLWQNRRRPSRLVKALAQKRIKELEQKAVELLAMKSALEHLVHCCHGDDRPECPILEGLAGADAVSAAAPAGTRRATQGTRRVPG
jgi:MerR family copper efflux transcriptional regulator